MDREIVLAILAPLFAGSSALCWSRWVPKIEIGLSAREIERRCWRRLWTPLFPSALVLAALGGWALLEPDDAEAVPWPVLALAIPFALIWARALLRAATSLRGRTDDRAVAFTTGLLRPRVIISPELEAATDAEACMAALEHERAHACHRDPLRIWLAAIAADLQWPSGAARARLMQWRHALELARDEEARCRGADGAALAAGIVAAVRLSRPSASAVAALSDASMALVERLACLLEPLRPDREPHRFELAARGVLIAAALSCAALIGATYGEVAVRTLFGLSP